MAHLPVRLKTSSATPAALLPMALVLAAGLLATGLWSGGRVGTLQATHEVLANVAAIRQAHMPPHALAHPVRVHTLAEVGSRPISASGHSWILASSSPITDFLPSELQAMGLADGLPLVANRVRGVPALAAHPHGYDRLYVDLGEQQYAPLRWSDRP